MTAPTLLGLPTNFDPEGKDLVDIVEKLEALKEKQPLLDLDAAMADGVRSIHDIEVHAQEIDLFEPFDSPEMTDNSTMAWMKTDQDHYEVNYPGAITGETLSLQQNRLGQWEIMLREFGDQRPIAKPTNELHDAFERAEEWLNINRSSIADTLRRDAGWRQRKASSAQMNALKRLKVKVKTDNLESGKASNLISLYKSRQENRR
jgi:hypothetical protein